MGSNSFILYDDWAPVIMALSPDNAGDLIQSLYAYRMGEEKFPEDLMTLGIYEMIRNRMDIDEIKYQEKCEKNRENGAKGGRPKKTERFIEKPNGFKNNPEKPNGFFKNPNDNDNDNDNELIKEKDKREKEPKGSPTPRFKKPTFDEIKAYCDSKGIKIDIQGFIDYYESNGWKVGKNPMKDWQATVRRWARTDRGQGNTKITAFGDFPQNKIDFGDLESKLLDN